MLRSLQTHTATLPPAKSTRPVPGKSAQRAAGPTLPRASRAPRELKIAVLEAAKGTHVV